MSRENSLDSHVQIMMESDEEELSFNLGKHAIKPPPRNWMEAETQTYNV